MPLDSLSTASSKLTFAITTNRPALNGTARESAPEFSPEGNPWPMQENVCLIQSNLQDMGGGETELLKMLIKLHYCAIIHLPAIATTQVVMQG
jgi:hypothetical protein